MCLSKQIGYDDVNALWKASDRFWKRVKKTDTCWEWTGTVMTAGYGELRYRGKKLGAHRFAYLLLVGPLESGRCICHTCDNRLCVNPAHLYQGTYRDNYDDILRRLQDAQIPDTTPQDPNFWDFLEEEPTCP